MNVTLSVYSTAESQKKGNEEGKLNLNSRHDRPGYQEYECKRFHVTYTSLNMNNSLDNLLSEQGRYQIIQDQTNSKIVIFFIYLKI